MGDSVPVPVVAVVLAIGLGTWLLVVARSRYCKGKIMEWAGQKGYEVISLSCKRAEIRRCPRKLSSEQTIFRVEVKERSSGRARRGWFIFGKYWSLFDDGSLSEVVWEEDASATRGEVRDGAI